MEKKVSNKIDHNLRSWTKSFTWRFIGILILLPLTYAFTGKWESAAALTLSFHLIRMVLYYFHERIWENILWGRRKELNRMPFYVSLIVLIISFVLTFLLFRE